MKLEGHLDRIAKRGTEAWKRVKKSRDLADWWIVGEALQVLQEEAMNAAGIPVGSNHPPTGAAYNAVMGELLQCYKLDDIDKGDRSRLLKMMEQRPAIEAWHRSLPLSHRLKLNHPSTVMRHWAKASEPPKPPSERKSTTLEKTEAALVEAQKRIDQLEAHNAELEGARPIAPADREGWIAALRDKPTAERVYAIYQVMRDLNLKIIDLQKFGASVKVVESAINLPLM
jgi:hypothetical protein